MPWFPELRPVKAIWLLSSEKPEKEVKGVTVLGTLVVVSTTSERVPPELVKMPV